MELRDRFAAVMTSETVYLMVDAMYEGIAGPNEKLILAAAPGAGGVQ